MIASLPRFVAALRSLSRASGRIALLVGALILLGWWFDIGSLKTILPGLVAMNPATAVAFLLAGASLEMQNRETASPQTRRIAQTLALLVALIGLIKLAGILFGFDAGIDQLLFREKLDVAGAARPNRMAPTTAANFLLLGLALMLLDAQIRRGFRIAQILALLVASVAALALIGYLYGVQSLTGVAAYIPMALHTALTFLLLSAGLLCARPERGIVARLAGDGPGGAMLRHFLLAIVLLPLGMGGLILAGQRARSYPEAFGFSLFVVLVIAVFSILAGTNAVSLDRKEGERKAADEALRRAYDELEQRVQERTADLAKVLLEIRGGIDVLGVSAGAISASTTHLAVGASETATAISETTTTVEEIRQTAQVSSQKAGQVAQRAQDAARTAQAGKKSTEGTVEDMQRIHDQMDAITEGMTRLSEQSQAIGEIIASVDDLADQSSLLAVNAAIEAARAGEQGKGFGVVAQEVKNLADQSRQATRQVRSILSDIQKATNAAALATEQGSKAVEAGVTRSAEAGESILNLAERITEAALAATQIAASSQQQLVGMDQMAQAMQSIKEASVQNVDSAKQLEASAQKLTALGQRLKQMVERYNL